MECKYCLSEENKNKKIIKINENKMISLKKAEDAILRYTMCFKQGNNFVLLLCHF